MPFAALPPTAAWRHASDIEGFEVITIDGADGPSPRIRGHVAALHEDGGILSLTYELTLDGDGRTRHARVSLTSAAGTATTELAGDGDGVWAVDGQPRPDLAGCLDVDLQVSAFTNALPMRRLALDRGGAAGAPAAYVRAPQLAVERLEQHYRRLPDDPRAEPGAGPTRRFHYRAPAFDFATEITYDPAGLVLDYPGIGTRAG